MGEIYLAAGGEVGFQKFCVIKTVISEKTDRAKANRFLDEAKVVLRLSHANLVPTFDAGEIENEFFIAMDLIEGKDLREIWNRCVRTRTRIPLDVALHIGREIARALAYVHSYGDLNLVHRDVAPPNILVSYFGEVKLTDFGLARSVLKQEHTAPGVVFGRASYLAPEQARGEVADARTDVYSLGIVLWELLTGNQYLQLANLDPATAMSLVRHPRPQPPSAKAPWITRDLDVLLMRALAPAREDRYQTAEEFRQALSDVMAKMAPRADAERAAAFVRGLYDNTIREERQERDKLLAESLALAARTPEPTTPLPRRRCPPPGRRRRCAQRADDAAADDGADDAAAHRRADDARAARDQRHRAPRPENGAADAGRGDSCGDDAGRGYARRDHAGAGAAGGARSQQAADPVPQRRRIAGRRFHGARHRQPLPRRAQDWRRAGWGRSTRRSTSKSARSSPSRSCTWPIRTSRTWSNGSGARRGRRRASATRTSST